MSTSLVRFPLVALAVACALSAAPAFAACAPSTSDQPAGANTNPTAVHGILGDAETALARGDFAEACVKFRLVLSLDTTNVAARLGLGEGALGEADYVAAQTHFQTVATAADANARAWQGLGLAHLLAGDMAGSVPHLGRAVELDAALWRAWNGLGIVADATSDWVAADAAWTAALAAAPDQPVLLNNKGMSLLRRGQAAAAIGIFEQALHRDPGLEMASNNRRVALATTGDYDGALAGLSDSALPTAMNNVAVVAARRGDRVVADRLLAAAITAAPRYYELAARNREAFAHSRAAH